MFRFPPSHGCLPPVGWGGLGFTALLPVAGRSGCLSAGAVSVSCSASLRPTVASYPRAGVVSVSRSFTLRFPPPHRASPPEGRGGPGFTVLLFQRLLAPGGEALGSIGRGGPGLTPRFPPRPPTAGTLTPTTNTTETIQGELPSHMSYGSGRKNLNSPRGRPRFTTENRCANWVPGRFSDAPVFPRNSQKVT